jgi:hypothetical protein
MSANDQELEKVIDASTADPVERSDSRLLYQALQERRGQLKAERELPQDTALTEKILAEARTRSAEISASRQMSGRGPVARAAVPWWVWCGWIVAIAAVVLAYRFLV